LRVAGLTRAVGFLLLLAMLDALPARAAELEVEAAESRLEAGVYRLEARVQIRLSRPVVEALTSGVPVTLLYSIRVLRPRSYLWDEGTATLQQRFRIEHHALTNRFVVTNLNTSAAQAFASLEEATRAVGVLDRFPLIDAGLLSAGEKYVGEIQVLLDRDALPAPLKLQALFDARWRLSSDPYRWPLVP
jgi:hypothetical protein